MSIEEILRKIDQEGLAPKVNRRVYDYKQEIALKYIQSIGGRLCPHFTLDGENRGVYEALTAWLMGNPFTAIDPKSKKFIDGRIDRGIYLYGGTGAGKSLAMDVMRLLTEVDNITCGYGKTKGELRWKKVRADEIARDYLCTGDISKWLSIPSLLIDDLGNEPAEVLYMGTRVDVLRMILESRGDRRDQLTLITSNIPMGEVRGKTPLRDRYGDRVQSRIVEMCNYLYLGGEDRRWEINT